MKKLLKGLILSFPVFFLLSTSVLANSYDYGYSNTSNTAGGAFAAGFMIIIWILICCSVILGIFLFVFTILMIIDVAKRDDYQDKTLWLVLLIVGLVFGFSFIITPLYYFLVKKKLDGESSK